MRGYFARFYRNREARIHWMHLMNDYWVLSELLPADKDFVAPPDDWRDMKHDANYLFEGRDFETMADAVAAYERLSDEALNAGCELTDLQEYTSREIPETAIQKPVWQQQLDHCLLDLERKRLDYSLPGAPEAASEPITLWLRSLQVHRGLPENAAQAKLQAEAALNEFQARAAAKAPIYTWSFPQVELEASIFDCLYSVYIHLSDDDAALDAINQALAASISPGRIRVLCWMQMHRFPQYSDDAFEMAFSNPHFPEPYDLVFKHPEYAAYAARRKAELKAGQALTRWTLMAAPAKAGEIAAVETRLGRALPSDYRTFLSERGRSQLVFFDGDKRHIMQFAGASDLVAWHETVQHWLHMMIAGEPEISARWKSEFGIDHRQLWSVATPFDNSSALVISLADGPTFGHCFLWHHDDAAELIPFASNFGAAIAALETELAKPEGRLAMLLL